MRIHIAWSARRRHHLLMKSALFLDVVPINMLNYHENERVWKYIKCFDLEVVTCIQPGRSPLHPRYTPRFDSYKRLVLSEDLWKVSFTVERKVCIVTNVLVAIPLVSLSCHHG